MPYRQAGLDDSQAAAHLLNRLAYGPRPGDLEQMVEIGLDDWLAGQLNGELRGPLLEARLARLPAFPMAEAEIIEEYSHPRTLVEDAVRRGLIRIEDYRGENGMQARLDALAALERYAQELEYRPIELLLAQLREQKLQRALHSESPLIEILTDFWFDHFYVSAHHPTARLHLFDYERRAIRPNVLARFRDLLGATAEHPAMLTYLDNARSRAEPERQTAFDLQMEVAHNFSPGESPMWRQVLARLVGWKDLQVRRLVAPTTVAGVGLNENYARELLELHTLGLEGGYSQRDVTEVARAFSGWGTFPLPRDPRFESLIERAIESGDFGFVQQGFFLFRPDYHDSESKRVLGVELAAERGLEDGEEVLDLLATHPATARHLARKLATRLIRDRPSERLVAQLAEVWELSGGDQQEMVRAIVASPEFWQSRGEKVKTPLELMMSALRGLDAQVDDVERLHGFLHRMGQPLYGALAPIGYPETGTHWLRSGSLLVRINFLNRLVAGQVEGVSVDLLELVEEDELASKARAVKAFWRLLLPGRTPSPGMLEAMRETSEVSEKVEERAATDLPPHLAELRRQEWRRHAAYGASLVLASPEFQTH